MRLSATKSLIERKDVIVVATVSSIYGLGSPDSYLKMVLHLSRGEQIGQRDILRRLAELQYKRNDAVFDRSSYRVRGDVIDVYPADSDYEALRIELFDDEVEKTWNSPDVFIISLAVPTKEPSMTRPTTDGEGVNFVLSFKDK